MVGKWWYGTQKVTKEKVLRPTAATFFQDYEDDMEEGQVVNVVSGGREFEDVLAATADSGLAKIEQSIVRNESSALDEGPTQKDQDKWQSFDGVRRKTAALLWSYLARKELDGGILDEGMSIYGKIMRDLTFSRKIRSRIDRAKAAGFGSGRVVGIQQYWPPTRNLQNIPKPDPGRLSKRFPSSTTPIHHTGHRARDRSSIDQSTHQHPRAYGLARVQAPQVVYGSTSTDTAVVAGRIQHRDVNGSQPAVPEGGEGLFQSRRGEIRKPQHES